MSDHLVPIELSLHDKRREAIKRSRADQLVSMFSTKPEDNLGDTTFIVSTVPKQRRALVHQFWAEFIRENVTPSVVFKEKFNYLERYSALICLGPGGLGLGLFWGQRGSRAGRRRRHLVSLATV